MFVLGSYMSHHPPSQSVGPGQCATRAIIKSNRYDIKYSKLEFELDRTFYTFKTQFEK